MARLFSLIMCTRVCTIEQINHDREMLSECSDPSLGAQCATWSFIQTICHQPNEEAVMSYSLVHMPPFIPQVEKIIWEQRSGNQASSQSYGYSAAQLLPISHKSLVHSQKCQHSPLYSIAIAHHACTVSVRALHTVAYSGFVLSPPESSKSRRRQ